MIASVARLMLLFSCLGAVSTAYSQQPLPPLPPPDENPAPQVQPQPGVKVAEKGPIHEAFAQPGAETRGKEITAPKAPPPPITEVPPDSKPEGANVKWIPGYWQWDENKNDFLWVSGFYRNIPPNREWEPGKWTAKDGKNIYVPGFWHPTDSNSWKANLPEPPKSIESGPSTPNDNPDAMWVPGGWEYRNNQFVWRAGYWAAPYRDMMWQPSQYVFNGDSYYFVPGYWDYPLENRGLLNAPVYIDPQFAQNPNWSFTPQFGIGVGGPNGWGNGGLFDSMYAGPNYNNYYYGNYGDPYGLGGLGFGSGYGEPLYGYGGFYPWWGTGIGFYNPLWNHYNWLNRNNRGWGANAHGGRNGQRGGVNGTGKGSLALHPTGTIGNAHGAVGAGAHNAARSALGSQSGQVVRPSSQVLANQVARASSFGAGNNFSSPGIVTRAGGATIQPGITSGTFTGSSMYGGVSQPSLRLYGSSGVYGNSGVGRGTSYYQGGGGSVRSSGGRASGGGGRGGGHR